MGDRPKPGRKTQVQKNEPWAPGSTPNPYRIAKSRSLASLGMTSMRGLEDAEDGFGSAEKGKGREVLDALSPGNRIPKSTNLSSK